VPRETSEVKANQPKAVPEQASLLRDAVSREVGGNVRFYTAVGSTLDIKHGIDGFFEFAGIVVAIDVTLNREKDVGKADIVVRGEDLDDLSSLAHHIVSEMLTKFKRKEAR
jgi:hypothetical protein